VNIQAEEASATVVMVTGFVVATDAVGQSVSVAAKINRLTIEKNNWYCQDKLKKNNGYLKYSLLTLRINATRIMMLKLLTGGSSFRGSCYDYQLCYLSSRSCWCRCIRV